MQALIEAVIKINRCSKADELTRLWWVHGPTWRGSFSRLELKVLEAHSMDRAQHLIRRAVVEAAA